LVSLIASLGTGALAQDTKPEREVNPLEALVGTDDFSNYQSLLIFSDQEGNEFIEDEHVYSFEQTQNGRMFSIHRAKDVNISTEGFVTLRLPSGHLIRNTHLYINNEGDYTVDGEITLDGLFINVGERGEFNLFFDGLEHPESPNYVSIGDTEIIARGDYRNPMTLAGSDGHPITFLYGTRHIDYLTQRTGEWPFTTAATFLAGRSSLSDSSQTQIDSSTQIVPATRRNLRGRKGESYEGVQLETMSTNSIQRIEINPIDFRVNRDYELVDTGTWHTLQQLGERQGYMQTIESRRN